MTPLPCHPLPPLRLAYFSPLPPARSGIADYSRALLPHLGQQVDITLFADRPETVDPSLQAQFTIRPLDAYPAERWDYDLALYQMGNSSHHAAMYPIALRYPGVIVLHDYGLHHFISHITAGRGEFLAYMREMGYALGAAGVELARQIRLGNAIHPLFEVPLNNRLLDRSLGLIVHSQHVAQQVRQQCPNRPVQSIPALIERRVATGRRPALNLSADTVIFASAGQVTAAKQPELILRVFSRLRQIVPNVHYLFIGESHEAVDLEGLIRQSGLEGAVTCTGFVAGLDDFVAWIVTGDVVVNLRHPTVGETSATALRALAAGRPVIVFDHGWYRELPDEVCYKIAPLDEDGLLAAMQELAQSAGRRQTMGQKGLAYVTTHHDPAAVAGQYIPFLNELITHYTLRITHYTPRATPQGGNRA